MAADVNGKPGTLLEERLRNIIPVPVEDEWNGILFVPYDDIIPESNEEEYPGEECIFVMN